MTDVRTKYTEEEEKAAEERCLAELKKITADQKKQYTEPATKQFVIDNIMMATSRQSKCFEMTGLSLWLGVINLVGVAILYILYFMK